MDYTGYAVPRADLGDALYEYYEEKGFKFIGLDILPVLRTPIKSAKISVITRESMLQNPPTRRAARSGYNRIGLKGEDKLYACQNHGIEAPIDDSERKNYATDFDLEFATTITADRSVRLAQEVRIKDAVFDTDVWTGASLFTDYSGAPWDSADSDIIGQVTASVEKSRRLTGRAPNTLICGKVALNNMLNNTGIKACFPGALLVTRAMIENSLPSIFGLEKLLVGGEVYDSANEGQDAVVADVWGDDYASVALVADKDDPVRIPCLGRTFLWTEYTSEIALIESYREEQSESDIIRVKNHVDELVFDPSFAHLMKIDA